MQLDGLHMTPGKSARLGNRSSDSHHYRPAAAEKRCLIFLPGLLANHEMAQRSIPALTRTCTRKMPSKAALLKRTRAQRIPFRPGVRYSNKGRIHSRRPILSSSLFACKTAADHTFRVDGIQRLTPNSSPRRFRCWLTVTQAQS